MEFFLCWVEGAPAEDEEVASFDGKDCRSIYFLLPVGVFGAEEDGDEAAVIDIVGVGDTDIILLEVEGSAEGGEVFQGR